MFSTLRQGSIFYILDKSGECPTLKLGQVAGVSQPTPKYGNSFLPQQQIDSVVDVLVKVGDEELKFEKLPSNLSIANFGQNGVVVAESKEAMNAEVEAMLRSSRQIIESVPYHQNVVSACDGMLRELDPQFAKEKEQEEKIGALEQKISGMEDKLSDIRNMLANALNRKKNDV
jgi:ribosome-associated translation inhibitor RaiA